MVPTPTADVALALIKEQGPKGDKILRLTLGKHTDITPGQFIPKAETFATPRLSLKSAKGSYIALCIDLDPPIVSWPFLGPILHWLQSDLVAQTAQEAHDGLVQLSSLDTPFIANYRGAGPPPISSPHRYVFLLYEQPSNFDIKIHAPNPGKEVGLSSRLRYDLSAFEKKANLGPVVAANYFCSN